MTSTSRPFRLVVALLAALSAAGCASRGSFALVTDVEPVGTVETVFVASTRTRTDTVPYFDAGRSETVGFATYSVSVPPDRAPGSIRYPSPTAPDARTEFVVVAAEPIADERAFAAAINGAIARSPAGAGNVTLFVHGFNTNFAEGLYRQAQLQYDLGRRGTSVHFAWPSTARTFGYLADREAVLYSRDGLEKTIVDLTRTKAASIDLVGHSMGAFLLMETLRTMARAGERAALQRVNSVLLIAPDIDVGVFIQQARPLVDLGVPIYVIVSDGDRALAASARLRGDTQRLGSISDKAELGGLDVTIVDLGQVQRSDLLGHFKVGTSPELIAFLRNLNAAGLKIFAGRRPGLINSSVALLQAGTEILIAPLVVGQPPGG
jgi:esterase/lipase superfamily enzyme